MKRIQIAFFLGLLLFSMGGIVWLRRGSPSQHHSVVLNWQVASAEKKVALVGYNVYRATAADRRYTNIATRVPAPPYRDAQVESGKNYIYVVTAVDAAGRESRFSAEATAQVP
jgi:fibronectin type 3 domain-containing protein